MSILTPQGGGGSSGGRAGAGGGGGSSGGRTDGSPSYPLGRRPMFRLTVDGKRLVTRAYGPGAQRNTSGFDAALQRVDIVLGIDQVHTLSITFVGEQSAKAVRDRFEKRTPIEVELGYEDHPNSFATMFRGEAVQAYPDGTNPVTVELEVDSLAYRAREYQAKGTGSDASQAEFIKSTLNTIGLDANLDSVTDSQADPGGQTEGSFLSFVNTWAKANFVHWLDKMDGGLHFFYPGAKPEIFRKFRTWTLSVRNLGDDRPAILNQWSPQVNFVDAPAEISLAWYDDRSADIAQQVVTATNPNGVPDSKLDLGVVYVKDADAAQAIVDAAAANYYWQSIEGDFGLEAGVPILPLDELIAVNPPEGLEAYYDTPMEVVKVHHILDERGWLVSGTMRGGR